MTDEQLNEKFHTLTERIGAMRSGQIAKVVSHIEDCENLAELSQWLTVDESTYQPRAGFNPGAPV